MTQEEEVRMIISKFPNSKIAMAYKLGLQDAKLSQNLPKNK